MPKICFFKSVISHLIICTESPVFCSPCRYETFRRWKSLEARGWVCSLEMADGHLFCQAPWCTPSGLVMTCWFLLLPFLGLYKKHIRPCYWVAEVTFHTCLPVGRGSVSTTFVASQINQRKLAMKLIWMVSWSKQNLKDGVRARRVAVGWCLTRCSEIKQISL